MSQLRQLKSSLLAMCMLLTSFAGIAQPIISGPNKVCQGTTSTYTITNAVPGWIYVWQTTNSIGNVVGTPSYTPAQVFWSGFGNCGIIVNAYNGLGQPMGAGTFNVTVGEKPVPYISTNVQVACQTLNPNPQPHEPGDLIADDDNGCIQVCENSIVKYFANAAPAGSTYQWFVTGTGATILGSSTGPAINVQWGSPTTGGSVKVVVTSPAPYNCTGEEIICVTVIEKPTASFAINPPPLTPATGTTPVCIKTWVQFTDMSSPLSGPVPITDWLWDFGDGSPTSSLQNPTHQYVSSGIFTVKLTVTNACGCTDVYAAEVEVYKDQGPEIVCPSVVCENEVVNYSTPVTCGTYNWNVQGGTILSGWGTPQIQIRWDNITDGFGYVSLATPCGGCPAPTVIKVPVIQTTPTVDGPTVLCVNEQAKLSLPLWPGTEYQWGVIGNPGGIIGNRDNHWLGVKFTSPGTYTIHVWWQNRIKLCGGDLKFTVTVNPSTTIVGNALACRGLPAGSYTLASGSSATWTLNQPGGPAYTTTGTVFTPPGGAFSFIGTNTLVATNLSGGFCDPKPLTIEVKPNPAPPSSISGATQVCFNQPYTYTANTAVSGSNFVWRVVPTSAATINPTVGNSITVTWNSAGTLYVKRVSLAAPYCSSDEIGMNVGPFVVNPSVTGNLSPLANCYANYSANYSGADAYTWSVTPQEVGSVSSGNYTANPTVLWNNITGTLPVTATLTVTVKKCGQNYTASQSITVFPNTLSLAGPTTTQCATDLLSFSATPNSGSTTYTWDFGDGTTGSGANVTHAYNPMGTAIVPYTVTVTASTPAGGCGPSGVQSMTVNINPGPIATLDPGGQTFYCVGSQITNVLQVIPGNIIPPATYELVFNGNPTGNFDPNGTFPVNATGGYSVLITDASGCSRLTNIVTILEGDCNPQCTPAQIPFNENRDCNAFTLEVQPPATGTGTWTWPTTPNPPSTAVVNGGGMILDITYPEVGVYNVTYVEDINNCPSVVQFALKVPLRPRFTTSVNCSTNPYVITFNDQSDILPPYWISNTSWSIVGTSLSANGTTNWTLPQGALTPGTTYTVVYTVEVTDGSDVATCTIQESFTMPQVPIVNFTAMPSVICEGVPIQFTPVVIAAGNPIVAYLWDFDDNSTNTQPFAQRTYTHSGPFNPALFNPWLTVTDAFGCVTSSQTQTVKIYDNLVSGQVTGPNHACQGSIVTLSYMNTGIPPISTYAWSHGTAFTAPTAPVNSTGAYFVTVEDANRCRLVTDPHPVSFYPPPPAIITGLLNICEGDVLKLDGYVGAAGYTYTWNFNGSTYNTPQLTVPMNTPGTYNVSLTVSKSYPGGITCSDVATAVVTVYAQPAPPIISPPSALSCSPYILQLNGSHPSMATQTYNWSNGTFGQTTQYTTGGPIRLFFTNLGGCTSYADDLLPEDPEQALAWFPTGCYDICNTRFPFQLPGPPGWYNGWAWNGPYSASGSGQVAPASITGPGSYTLSIDNGLCSATSVFMDITQRNCDSCPDVFRAAKLSCDPSNPAGYTLDVTVINPAPGTSYVFGMDIGPLIPFAVTLPQPGGTPVPLTFSFTALNWTPPPPMAQIQVNFTVPGMGFECYDTFNVAVPYPCGWANQKQVIDGAAQPSAIEAGPIATLLGYPNPANSDVTLAYDYATQARQGTTRSLIIYDATGRMVHRAPVSDVRGNITVPVGSWAAGTYLVRMEESGKTLLAQRLSVTH